MPHIRHRCGTVGVLGARHTHTAGDCEQGRGKLQRQRSLAGKGHLAKGKGLIQGHPGPGGRDGTRTLIAFFLLGS